ncbi:MAG: hypothetical protein WCP52_03540 [Bacteroidota bacterium]
MKKQMELRKNCKHHSHLLVPATYWHLTSFLTIFLWIFVLWRSANKLLVKTSTMAKKVC